MTDYYAWCLRVRSSLPPFKGLFVASIMSKCTEQVNYSTTIAFQLKVDTGKMYGTRLQILVQHISGDAFAISPCASVRTGGARGCSRSAMTCEPGTLVRVACRLW